MIFILLSFFSGRLKELSVIRHMQGEEMMQSLKFNLSLWFQLLDIMVLVLLLVLHIHPINKPRHSYQGLKLKANSQSLLLGPTKLHVCLQRLLLVLLLLKLKIALK